MGQGQSRSSGDDVMFAGGVRVTQGLLEQLEGKAQHRALPQHGATKSPVMRPDDAEAAAAAALAAQDRSVGRALERSRRVGNLLLKAEGEELRRIDTLAQELVAREYAAPSRPRPCQQQAADCLRCYTEHAADTLACAAAVDAYSECAKAAWQEALLRSSGP